MSLIRRFRPSDFERVIAIEKEAFGEYNPILFMTAYETFPDGFLVAEEDGHVVGFLTTVVISLFDVKILSIAVDKRCQNKGFASMLLKALFQVLRTKGILRLLLEVRLSNIGAQRLYLSLGFNLVKVIAAYYQDGEDAYLMEKRLVNQLS
ncbi:MAG: ribosomal protein S18-alanine N-acetyltransferase [Halobacteriota archaeon]